MLKKRQSCGKAAGLLLKRGTSHCPAGFGRAELSETVLRQGGGQGPRHGGGLFPVQVQAQGRQPPLQVPEARLQLMGQGRPLSPSG